MLVSNRDVTMREETTPWRDSIVNIYFRVCELHELSLTHRQVLHRINSETIVSESKFAPCFGLAGFSSSLVRRTALHRNGTLPSPFSFSPWLFISLSFSLSICFDVARWWMRHDNKETSFAWLIVPGRRVRTLPQWFNSLQPIRFWNTGDSYCSPLPRI